MFIVIRLFYSSLSMYACQKFVEVIVKHSIFTEI